MYSELVGRKQILKRQVVVTRTRFRNTWKSCLALAVVILVVGFVGLRLQIKSLDYQYSNAQKTKEQLLKDRRLLEIKMATLKAPDNVSRVAMEKMGLSDPGSRIFYLE